MTKRILLVGYGRAGKDEGLKILSRITGLKNAGCTSLYLAKFVAEAKGMTVEEVYETRHADRQLWYELGNRLRADNPGILLNEALSNGPLTGGVRDKEEVVYAKSGVVDYVVWIENNRVPVDGTVMFGPEDCDCIIQNNGTIEEFEQKLARFASFAGLIGNRG